MRLLAVAALLSACVPRVETTRVTLFDQAELAVEGSGTADQAARGLVENDLVLVGRPADVLAFDGDKLHMHLRREEFHNCRKKHCDRVDLDLRIDTPLANVRSIHAVSVASHGVIPLGLVTGCVLTVLGGGMVAYERAEHFGGSIAPPALALGFGLAILAIEIHARLASDEVTLVR